jgi:hypothetical protein
MTDASETTTTTGEPVCGWCGYSTRGLGALTCPECGADFRRVGIFVRRSGSAGWRKRVAPILAFTIAMAFIASAVIAAASELLPARRAFVTSTTLKSASGPREYVLSGDATTWADQRPVIPIRIDLKGASSSPVSAMEVSGGQYAYGTGATYVTGTFNPTAVLAWMKLLGLDTTDPALAREAQHLAGQARRMARLEVPSGGSYTRTFSSQLRSTSPFASFKSSSSGSERKVPYAEPAIAAMFLMLWAVGVRYFALTARTIAS